MTNRLDALTIPPAASIREAMIAIEQGAVEIALVTESGRLQGVVSDGDIRRALLRGANIDDAVRLHMSTAPLTVSPSAPRAEVLDLMQARAVSQVPVVDASGRLLGLHILRDVLGGTTRPNSAVIMAGGRGTRLGKLTERIPKPMVPVAGRPILERLVLHLVSSGIKDIYISVNYLRDVIETHFGDGSHFGCRIEYLREQVDRPLGTAGALALLPDAVRGGTSPILLLNGDLITDCPIHDLLDFHSNSGCVATIAVKEHTYEVPFGVVESGEDDRVTRIVEKPTNSWPVNAGMYVLNTTVVGRVPRDCQVDIPSLLEDVIDDGQPVGMWMIPSDWQDVGRLPDLHAARGEA